MITIVSVGKKHEDWVLIGIERYQKRLISPFDIKWELLPHSSLQGNAAREEESERIASRLDDRSFVLLLDETGREFDSPAFAARLEKIFVNGQHITIVIGGAYGVNEQLKGKADLTVSFSKMVFPHQLVRLIITEQIYRAQEIARGGKYHHE